MKQTINFYGFQKAFQDLRPNSFSYEGLRALFEYLEELEDSTGIEQELDVIELSGAYNEYDSVEHYHTEYSLDHDIDDNLVAVTDSGTFILQAH